MSERDFLGRTIDNLVPTHSAREIHSRRVCWRRGAQVLLSDGTAWWLHPVDLPLILTSTRLRRDINTALKVLQGMLEETRSRPVEMARHALYHAQMVQMGVTLLQENYEIPTDDLSQLVLFAQLDQTFHFTRVIAEVFAAALPMWSSLLVDGRLPL